MVRLTSTLLHILLASAGLLIGQYHGLSQSIDDIQYDIAVALDDEGHTLTGTAVISFSNGTGEQLDQACIHLYPNAYSSTETAFAKQQLAFGYTDFQVAKTEERGYIRLGEVTSDRGKVAIYTDPADPDIAWLRFRDALGLDSTVSVTIPFEVKVPASFSRLGRVGQSYQVSQWYPKLAMYDGDGWHPLPYLDVGEFYSEFADYHVAITVPQNYIVAATGVLQDTDERDWLSSLSDSENTPTYIFPASSTSMKTIHYRADNVIDFAWFADKRFAVRHDTVCLEGSCVDIYAYFTALSAEKWERATEYIGNAVRFFSTHVGPYPYPVVSAVESPLSASTGMEYPMITLIGFEDSGFTLDRVLAHEVGHNWFYGILASNERAYPWMDEGLVSYYENRYIQKQYGQLEDEILLHLTKRLTPVADPLLLMSFDSRRGLLQSPETDPAETTDNNYWYGAYLKGAYAFRMLEEWMGTDAFDKAMRDYYRQWEFGHPQPSDIREVLEAECNCNLGWLFDDLMSSNRMINYGIGEYEASSNQLELHNRGGIVAPVEVISVVDGDTSIRWIPGFEQDTVIRFSCEGRCMVSLYDGQYSLDDHPDDNYKYFKSDRPVHKPFKVTMLSGAADPSKQLVNIAPVVAWNYYDRVMIGANVSNLYWPASNFEYSITPLLSFGQSELDNSIDLSGLADLRYRIYPKTNTNGESPWKEYEIGFEVKSFHYNFNDDYGFRDRYLKWAPRVQLKMHPSPLSFWHHKLKYRFIGVHQFYGEGIDFFELEWEKRKRSYFVNEFTYELKNANPLMSSTSGLTIHQGKGFLRFTGEHNQKFSYGRYDKGVYVRLFAGWLPFYDEADAYVPFLFNGTTSTGYFSKDYLYDELLFGRNEREDILSQQVFLRDAQLKTLYNGGISDNWMMSVGVAGDIPGPVPFQLYVDAVLYDDPVGNGVTISYSAGVSVVVLREAFEIYIPLLESSDIRNSLTYEDRNFLQRISFVLDLNKVAPRSLRDDFLH